MALLLESMLRGSDHPGDLEKPFEERVGCLSTPNHPIIEDPARPALARARELPFYQRAGMECAMYGPNYRAGSSDEHITIEELTNLTKAYTVAILEACGIA